MRKKHIEKIRVRNPQMATVADVQKIIDKLQGKKYLDINRKDGSFVSVKLDDEDMKVKMHARSGIRGTKAALDVSIGWNMIVLIVNTVRFDKYVIYVNEGSANEAHIVLEALER